MTSPINGGSTITSYNLRWDRGLKGEFYELVGFSTSYTSLSLLVTGDAEGLTPGQEYMFQYRAQNKYGWGEFSDSVTFIAAAVPKQANPVYTTIENLYVKISWDEPDDQSSPIVEYDILIRQKNGTFTEQRDQFCQGNDLAVVSNRYCHIPVQSVLRQAPYNLAY